MSIFFIYIINVLLLVAISYWSYVRYKSSPLKKHFWSALVFKIICGVLLGQLFYNFYEGGDTLRYYKEATELAALDTKAFYSAISENTMSSQPVRAIYFVRLVAAIKYLTHADYWLLSAYFSLISFLGAFYLSDKLIQWNEELTIPVITGFLYFPSLVFWSSGLLKDSLAFSALTLLIGTYLSWYQNRKLQFRNALITVVAFAIIISLKYYIAAALIPMLTYLVLCHLLPWKKWGIIGLWRKTSLLVATLSIPMLVLFTWLSPNLSYFRLWQIMQQNHDAYIKLAPDGSIYTLGWFGNSWDVFFNLPYLWFSGIFRPLFGEDFSFPAVLSGIENLFLLIIALLGIYSWIKNKITWTPELLSVLIYISALSIFLCYSVPNFGTLARFKIYFAPWVILTAMASVQKLFPSWNIKNGTD